MTQDTVDTMSSSRRVFLSYAYEDMGPWATALRESLRRKRVRVVGEAPQAGEDLRRYYADAISNAHLMVILMRAGDESRPWLQFETQMMLQACWKNSRSRIAVVAPAVGAIPSALRHQDFVHYFAHADAQLHRWQDLSVIDSFSERLLRESSARSRIWDPMSDEEVRDWRNRLVHISSRSLPDSPEERERLRVQLSRDLKSSEGDNRARSIESKGQERERLLDRALLAAALGESDLVTAYYQRLQALRTKTLPDETLPRQRLGENEDTSFRLGLIALEAKDYGRARTLFGQSVDQYSARYGRAHPAAIAALYNLAIANAEVEDTAEATRIFEDVLERSRASLGDHHPQTAVIANNLASLLEKSGDRRRAQELLELAAEAYRAVRPADSPELADVLRRIDVLGAPRE